MKQGGIDAIVYKDAVIWQDLDFEASFKYVNRKNNVPIKYYILQITVI